MIKYFNTDFIDCEHLLSITVFIVLITDGNNGSNGFVAALECFKKLFLITTKIYEIISSEKFMANLIFVHRTIYFC